MCWSTPRARCAVRLRRLVDVQSVPHVCRTGEVEQGFRRGSYARNGHSLSSETARQFRPSYACSEALPCNVADPWLRIPRIQRYAVRIAVSFHLEFWQAGLLV